MLETTLPSPMCTTVACLKASFAAKSNHKHYHVFLWRPGGGGGSAGPVIISFSYFIIILN